MYIGVFFKIYFIEYQADKMWQRIILMKDFFFKLHRGERLRLLCLDNLKKCNIKQKIML